MSPYLPPPRRPDLEVENALARAALFRLLARGFAYPGPGHVAEMGKAFADLDGAQRRRAFAPRLAARLSAARQCWRSASGSALGPEHLRLFHGSGPVSLHETAYGDGRRFAGRPVEVADIGGFYLAFGLSIDETDPDLPDHLCAELEFVSLLLVKESYALSRAWTSRHRIARAARRTFLEHHLGRWVGEFARSVKRQETAPPYRSLADLLAETVTSECRRLRIHPVLFEGRLCHDAMQEDAFACPRAEVAPEMRGHNT
ncbi:MAG: molecular chaperone TorD family protein [Dongiaceae bacterium]